MKNKKLTAYISGALISAKDLQAARLRYELLANSLDQIGIETYLPHQQTDPTIMASLSAENVFEKDIEALTACDFIVAFLDEPSLGVGAEIALAIFQHKPVVAVFHQKQTVSRFILGMLKNSGSNTIIPYANLEDITQIINDKFIGGVH